MDGRGDDGLIGGRKCGRRFCVRDFTLRTKRVWTFGRGGCGGRARCYCASSRGGCSGAWAATASAGAGTASGTASDWQWAYNAGGATRSWSGAWIHT